MAEDSELTENSIDLSADTHINDCSLITSYFTPTHVRNILTRSVGYTTETCSQLINQFAPTVEESDSEDATEPVHEVPQANEENKYEKLQKQIVEDLATLKGLTSDKNLHRVINLMMKDYQ